MESYLDPKWNYSSDVGYFEKEDKYDEKNVSMEMRMRVRELYDEFLLRLNSKMILHIENGSMNNITLEWRYNLVKIW